MNIENIQLLREIKDALVLFPAHLSTVGKEGRMLAKDNEDEIKEHLVYLQTQGVLSSDIEMVNPPETTSKGNKTDRSWWDICFGRKSTGHIIPVNIKCAKGFNEPINVSGWLPLAWTFTNLPIKLEDQTIKVPKEYAFGRGGDPWKFSRMVNQRQGNKFIISGRDYGFLVVNRANPSDVVINTLLNLKKISRNPSNLPFQVKWNDNREPSMADPEIAANLIGEAIAESARSHMINELKKFRYGQG